LLPPVFKGKTTNIKMLSPISVRSTLQTKEGTKKTYYYSPMEKEFSGLIRENLLKKYYSFLGCFPANTELTVTPLFFSVKKNFHLLLYKDYVIKAYSGVYQLEGSNELKQFAYDSGLGERNCQGFGMFEPWNNQKRSKNA